jgi:hypothetical protein
MRWRMLLGRLSVKLETIAENFASLAVIPAALLYFVGYVYLYFYCQGLGIDAVSLKYDTFTIMVYAIDAIVFPLTVIVEHWHWTLATLAAFGAVFYLGRIAAAKFPLKPIGSGNAAAKFLRRTAKVLATICLATAVYYVAQAGGEYRAGQVLGAMGPPVQFQFTDAFRSFKTCQPGKCQIDSLMAANDLWCLHRLIETETSVVAVCNPGSGSTIAIFEIPKNAIAFQNVQPNGRQQ